MYEGSAEVGEEDEMLPMKEALRRLNISRDTLNRWIKAGRIEAIPSSTALDKPRLFFRAADVQRLLQPKGEA